MIPSTPSSTTKEDLWRAARKAPGAQPGKNVSEAAGFNASARARPVLASCDDSEANEGEPCWPVARAAVVDELLAAVQNNPSHFVPLVELLRPARRHLVLLLTRYSTAAYVLKPSGPSPRVFWPITPLSNRPLPFGS